MRLFLLTAVVVTVLGLLAWSRGWFTAQDAEPVDPPQSSPQNSAHAPGRGEGESSSETMAADSAAEEPVDPAAESAGEELAGSLLLPDGQRVPTLNGIDSDLTLSWPRTVPFSPIVRTERAGKLDWYVHANGMKSTTQLVFRTDLGRMDPVAVVGAPRDELANTKDDTDSR